MKKYLILLLMLIINQSILTSYNKGRSNNTIGMRYYDELLDIIRKAQKTIKSQYPNAEIIFNYDGDLELTNSKDIGQNAIEEIVKKIGANEKFYLKVAPKRAANGNVIIDRHYNNLLDIP